MYYITPLFIWIILYVFHDGIQFVLVADDVVIKPSLPSESNTPFMSIFRDGGFESADNRRQRTFLRGNWFLRLVFIVRGYGLIAVVLIVARRDVACNVSVRIVEGMFSRNISIWILGWSV